MQLNRVYYTPTHATELWLTNYFIISYFIYLVIIIPFCSVGGPV